MIKHGKHEVFREAVMNINGYKVQPVVIQNRIDEAEIVRLAVFLTESISVDREYDLEGLAKLVVHPGRRGITGNLYYVGRWVDTFEMFHLSCYRFHHESEYELMTHANPIMCSHDVETVVGVLRSFEAATEAGRLDAEVFFR